MRLPNQQRGLGMWGLMYVFGTLGLFFLVGMKCAPVYLNHMKVTKAVNSVAMDQGNANAAVPELRSALQRRWDVDDISYLTPADVKVKKTDRGRSLSYDYEAREPLFKNISIVIQFKAEVPMRGGP